MIDPAKAIKRLEKTFLDLLPRAIS